MRFLIGIIVFAIIIVLSYTNGFLKMEWLAHGWNVPSFIIVIIPSIVFSICITSWKTVKACFVVLFSDNKRIGASDKKKIQIFLKAFGDIAFFMGILATLIGVTQICIVPSQINNLGPNVSEALTTVVYGLIIKIITNVANLRVDYKS